MPENNLAHNGLSVNYMAAPPSMGPLESAVFAIVGTAPDRDPALTTNVMHRIANSTDAAKLDLAGDERGTLWRTVHEIHKLVGVVIYVCVVDEGVDQATTLNNLIGSEDANTGALSGIQAITSCPEMPTHIAAPGFHSKPLSDALVAMAKQIYAIPVMDGPNTNDTDAIAFSDSINGVGTGYDKLYCVDPLVSVYSKAAQGNVFHSAAAMALSCFARVKSTESPAKGGMGVNIEGTSRPINYQIMDKTSNANLMLKRGMSFFARTSLGGYSLIGNRSITGRFINQVGLENGIIRKLAKVAQQISAKNLTVTFMQNEIRKLNRWLSGLSLAEELIGANVRLHPTLNTVDTYNNGEWHIAINYAGFAPNEHLVIHLKEDNSIVESFIQGAL